jgi:hypothetical protein
VKLAACTRVGEVWLTVEGLARVIQKCVVGTEAGHGFWPVGTGDWAAKIAAPSASGTTQNA